MMLFARALLLLIGLALFRNIESQALRWAVLAMLVWSAALLFVETDAGKWLIQHWTGELPVYWAEVFGRWLRTAIFGLDAA